METIKKEITVTRYVAFDGTEFETEAECLHFEGSSFGELMKQLETCTLSHCVLPDGSHNYFLVPKTRHDIYVLSQVLKMGGIDNPCSELYEHLTLLNVRMSCNTVVKVDAANFEDYVKEVSNGQFCVVSTIKDKKQVK